MGEIKEVFRGKNINDSVWKGIIKEVDDNGDGKVYFSLFFYYLILNLIRFQTLNLKA